MVRVTAYCWVILALSTLPISTLAFFRFQDIQPQGVHGVLMPLHDGNPNIDFSRFWNIFHTRIMNMEQAAHQNAQQLEGLLRRWIPEPPTVIPGTPLDLPKDGFEPEHDHVEDEEDHVDPFHPNPFFTDDEIEEDGYGGFGAAAGGLFHALGIRPPRPGRPGVATSAGFPRVWWQGPNVCVTREEIEDSDKDKDKEQSRQMSSVSATTFIMNGGDSDSTYHFSTCEQSPTKYVCTTVTKENGVKKTNIVTHQCCHGYRRNNNNFCVKMNLKDVIATAKDMGAMMFAQSIEASGMDMDAMKKRNVTLFAPSDTAMQGFNNALLEQNEVEVYVHARRRRDVMEDDDDNNVIPANNLKDLVLSHVVPGLIDIREAVDEQLLFSENSQNSSIRLNICPTQGAPVVTANCVLVRSESPAENGAVVVVDRMLSPVTRSLADLIEDNPKLSTFKKLLEKTNIWEEMKTAGAMTAFAPTDEAFENLPSGFLVRLLEGGSCVDNVLQNHIARTTLCSSCVETKFNVMSMSGDPLTLTRQPGKVEGSEDIYIENATLTKTDIMATNGVLHVIDDVLMPYSARSLSKVLSDRRLHNLVRAINANKGFMEELDSMKNVTFFVPSDEALQRFTGNNIPRETLLYHMTQQEITSCEFENNLMLKSQLEDNKLRMNLYQTMPTFNVGPVRATLQCARVTYVDAKACGAIVHEVDRIVKPPTGDIIATLEKQGGFTTLIEMIKGTKYEDKFKGDTPLTLLAPTNEAFELVSADFLEKLKTDVEMREHIIAKHVLTEVMCCDGIATPDWPFTNHVATDFGTRLPLRRGPTGVLNVGPLTLKTCDIMATNGVIHSVDAVRVNGGAGRRSNPGFVGKSPNNPNVEVQIYGL